MPHSLDVSIFLCWAIIVSSVQEKNGHDRRAYFCLSKKKSGDSVPIFLFFFFVLVAFWHLFAWRPLHEHPSILWYPLIRNIETLFPKGHRRFLLACQDIFDWTNKQARKKKKLFNRNKSKVKRYVQELLASRVIVAFAYCFQRSIH